MNLPTWGINTDTTYLIQDVQLTMTTDGTTIEYHYRVTFGGDVGVQEFFIVWQAKRTSGLKPRKSFIWKPWRNF